jgi:NAD(P)H-flavin reductase
VSYACKSGNCGSCLLRAVEGQVPPRAQAGLKETWKIRGYFLPCVCLPEGDLHAAPVDADARVGATITSLEGLAPDVIRVGLVPETPLDFRPGQYVTVLRGDGLARSYSIASLPGEGEIELHVRRVPQGKMSCWLHDAAQAGDRVSVQGPTGECFYVPGREDQPLLLAGAGTGLAPLYGILRDALRHGHRGPIHLVHGAIRAAGLYLHHDLERMAAHHDNFSYLPSVLEQTGPIDRMIAEHFPELDGWRAYICGDPAIVQTLRKKLFLAGIAMRDIHADAFLPSAG